MTTHDSLNIRQRGVLAAAGSLAAPLLAGAIPPPVPAQGTGSDGAVAGAIKDLMNEGKFARGDIRGIETRFSPKESGELNSAAAEIEVRGQRLPDAVLAFSNVEVARK